LKHRAVSDVYNDTKGIGRMKKLALLAMVLGIGGVVGVTALTASAGDDDGPACHRTEFKTQLVHDACIGADGKSKSSQKRAKAAMQAFLKDNKSKKPGLDCTTCHKKLAPEYPLKDDALKTFQDLGGKLLASSGAGGTVPPITPAKP
jgi:hypothetical protein